MKHDDRAGLRRKSIEQAVRHVEQLLYVEDDEGLAELVEIYQRCAQAAQAAREAIAFAESHPKRAERKLDETRAMTARLITLALDSG